MRPESPQTPPRLPPLPEGNLFLDNAIVSKVTSPIQDIRSYYIDELKERAVANLIPQPNSQDQKRDLEHLLDGPFCVGEAHSDMSPKKFLIQNMPLLAQNGFEVLFLEHIFSREHKQLLDSYFESAPGSALPPELEKKLDHLNEGHMSTTSVLPEFNFKTLVIAAKVAGIRVVAIDHESLWRGEDVKIGYNRVLLMNAYAKTIIESTIQNAPSTKWCALVGRSHFNSHKFSEEPAVPGISDIFADCQDILVKDVDPEMPKTTIVSNLQKQNVVYTDEKLEEAIIASLVIDCDGVDDLSMKNLLKIKAEQTAQIEVKRSCIDAGSTDSRHESPNSIYEAPKEPYKKPKRLEENLESKVLRHI